MESQNVEYKEVWRDEYLKWICGFANAQGGKLFVGVDDNGNVTGVPDAKRLMEDIPNKIATTLGLVCAVNLRKQNGLDYVEITVDASDIPINYHGQYHYRSGSTKQELTGSALQQFILKKMGRSWDDAPNRTATIYDDIDQESVSYFIKKAVQAGRMPKDSATDSVEVILSNLNLISDDGRLKNSAILLFGKSPSKFFTGISFRIGRFGIDDTDLIIQDSIDGNLIQITDKVMDVLKAKYLVSYIHYAGIQRVEPLEIPEVALREAIFNAVVHKDYYGSDIQMKVYNDRITLWNDGTLPEGMSLEMLFRSHPSKLRNKNIANVFYRAGFIETWGRGIEKIVKSLSDSGLRQPVIEEHCGGILVTMFRPKDISTIGKATNQESLPTTCLQLAYGLPVQVWELLICIGTSTMSKKEISSSGKVSVKSREILEKAYLRPAMEMKLVEMLYPEAHRHPNQKYFLTELGLSVLGNLKSK